VALLRGRGYPNTAACHPPSLPSSPPPLRRLLISTTQALVRDVPRFQSSCGLSMRRIPLLYAAMDTGTPWRRWLGDYLTCAADSKEDKIDVFGINTYNWCSSTTSYRYSGYWTLNEDFSASCLSCSRFCF